MPSCYRRRSSRAPGGHYCGAVIVIPVAPGPQLVELAARASAVTAAVSRDRVGSDDLTWRAAEIAAAVSAEHAHLTKRWVLIADQDHDLAAIELEASLTTDGPPDCEPWLHPDADVAEVLPLALQVCRDFATEHGRDQHLIWFQHVEQDERLDSPVGAGSIGRDEVAEALLAVGARLAQVYRISAIDPARSGEPTELAAGYRAESWFGSTPDALRPLVARMHEVTMADAPAGETGYVPEPFTPERVAAEEAQATASGRVQLSVLVLAADGSPAGYTQLHVVPAEAIAWQQDTVVAPEHRGRGIGRALKTRSARLLADAHPGLRRAMTFNAAENVHMLRINEELGWQAIAHKGVWLSPGTAR